MYYGSEEIDLLTGTIWHCAPVPIPDNNLPAYNIGPFVALEINSQPATYGTQYNKRDVFRPK